MPKNEKPTWTLRQTDMSDFPEDRAIPIDLSIQTGPSVYADCVNPINDAMNGSIPQGSFFAYLFRRFGYPERGWDDGKELVSYLLTTPRPDLLVRIVPHAGAQPHLSISFRSTGKVHTAANDYPYRKRDAHKLAFYNWVEQQGLVPDWFEEWMEHLNNTPGPIPVPEGLDRPKAAEMLFWIRYAHQEGENHPWHKWHEITYAAYLEAYPIPEPEYRSADWTTWSDDDPLKPYMAAALETLEELKRPVWIRDVVIDPWGPVKDYDFEKLSDVDFHPVAGHASGALGNADPKGFGELHWMILQLSPDNPAEGIAKAREILEAAAQDDAKT